MSSASSLRGGGSSGHAVPVRSVNGPFQTAYAFGTDAAFDACTDAMAYFEAPMDLTVLFEGGDEHVYESIIAVENTGPHLCLQAEDKSFYALERDRILSVHFRTVSGDKTAVDVADVFT